MPLDHSKASVSLSVAGLALTCINGLKGRRGEIGILRCDRHEPVLDIQRININPETGEPISSSLIEHKLNLNEDISVDLIYPDEKRCAGRGVSTYMRRGFDRLDDIGDEEDFRWIPDLEGPEFHGKKLRIVQPSSLKPTIFISDGVFYTRQKTLETFARYSIKGKASPRALGKLAYGINADIACGAGGAIVLRNRSAERPIDRSERCTIRLEPDESVRYLISIENHCRLAAESEGTDFRLFYEVAVDPDGRSFDLRRIVETCGWAGPEDPVGDGSDFTLDGFPEKCLTVFLGQTDSLEPNA